MDELDWILLRKLILVEHHVELEVNKSECRQARQQRAERIRSGVKTEEEEKGMVEDDIDEQFEG